MKTKVHIIIVFLFVSYFSIFSQQKWKQNRIDAFYGLGVVNYYGDIGGYSTSNYLLAIKDTRTANTGLAAYCGANYRYTARLSSKVNIFYGLMRSNDAVGQFPTRDFSFRTHMLETSAQLEYSIISEFMKKKQLVTFNRKGKLNSMNPYNLYVFGGIGNVMFLPKLNKPGRPTDQVTSFGTSLVFPLGAGVKWNVNNILSLGIEFGGRYTMTDLIDGIIPRGSKSNDIYYFTTFSFNYKIKTDRNGWPLLFKRVPKLFNR